jgi:hypothetical protein
VKNKINKEADEKAFMRFGIIATIIMIIFWCWYMPVYHPDIIYYMLIA